MNAAAKIREELLVIRCVEGDREAFEGLVELWQERLYRHAYQLTGEEDAAWDAVQETWTAIVNGIRKLREPAAFAGWAYRILGAKCADVIRSRQRQRKLAGKLALEDEASEAPSADHIAVRQAMAKLPSAGREILSLRYAVGCDTAEIAGILRIPEGTVKSRLHTAREELRRLMEGGQ